MAPRRKSVSYLLMFLCPRLWCHHCVSVDEWHSYWCTVWVKMSYTEPLEQNSRTLCIFTVAQEISSCLKSVVDFFFIICQNKNGNLFQNKHFRFQILVTSRDLSWAPQHPLWVSPSIVTSILTCTQTGRLLCWYATDQSLSCTVQLFQQGSKWTHAKLCKHSKR